ncbi:MAG TPA: ATP-binding protein [Verrucomicrobiae bacterium]|nr:ATP-binding protein [Verrucomicrobiae bacterium]
MGWLLACALGATCAWLIARYVAPSAKLAEICRALASGTRLPSFVARGAPPIRRAIRDLETVAHQFRDRAEKLDATTFNLRTILTGMDEGIMVIDRHFQIQLTNRALEQMFDLPSSPVGRTILEALRNHEIQLAARETILHGADIEREITLLRDAAPSAPARSLTLHASPLEDGAGNVRGAVVVLHDISRIKWMEESRKEFVSNTSHELRTPLAIFNGYLETLIENPDSTSSEARPILLTLQRHSNRLTELVEDLLTLSNLESGTLRLSARPIDLAELITRAIADIRMTPQAADRVFRTEFEGVLPRVEADPARVEQILYNLLDNAARYSKTPTPITVRARVAKAEPFVECAVIDEGSGIPASDLPRIFERFYRVEKARSRTGGGTGLGLSIAKHLVAAHGGTISAESELGKGTAIRFTLRRAATPHPDGPAG